MLGRRSEQRSEVLELDLVAFLAPYGAPEFASPETDLLLGGPARQPAVADNPTREKSRRRHSRRRRAAVRQRTSSTVGSALWGASLATDVAGFPRFL